MKLSSGEHHLRSLSLTDLTRMSGFSSSTVSESIRKEDLENLTYRSLTKSEKDKVKISVREILRDNTIAKAGFESIERWRKGWQQILEQIRLNGVNENTLSPQYFTHNIMRFNGDYILPTETNFENCVFHFLNLLTFKHYLTNISNVIEFGCGTGANLLQIHKLFPEIQLTGCDWAEPSQQIINQINLEIGTNITPLNFNLFTLDGHEKLDITDKTAVVTIHSMEQLGFDFEPFLEMLLTKEVAICLHLEPIIEFYNANLEFDALAIKYHRKRNYLKGFLNKLLELEKSGKIEVLKAHRCGFGSLYHEAYSIIIWRTL